MEINKISVLTLGYHIAKAMHPVRERPDEKVLTQPDMVSTIEDQVNQSLQGMLTEGYLPIYNRGVRPEFENWENMSIQERQDVIKTFTKESLKNYKDLEDNYKKAQTEKAAKAIADKIIADKEKEDAVAAATKNKQ